MFGKNTSL